MRLWFGFLFILGPVVIIAAICSFTLDILMLIVISIVMVIFGCALTHGAFNFEIPKTKHALLKIVKGREEASEHKDAHYRVPRKSATHEV
jgi:hypothetical protein